VKKKKGREKKKGKEQRSSSRQEQEKKKKEQDLPVFVYSPYGVARKGGGRKKRNRKLEDAANS